MDNPAGIYVIADLTAGKSYIGSSVNLPKRIKQHLRDLKSKDHDNWKLQKAFCDNNNLAVLTIPMQDPEEILSCEQQLLDEFFDKGSLYNLARDATAPMRGRTHSSETKEKMRIASTGVKHSPETLARLSEIAQARGIPREVIEAGATARRGKPLTPEHVEKVRATSKERMTPEAREHLRQVNLGIPHTTEDIERMKQIKRERSGRAVVIDGQSFNSVAEAAEKLNIESSVVRYRLNSQTDAFRNWNYRDSNLE